MSMDSNTMSPADFAAVTGNGNNAWGGDGAWWIIILFLFCFMGWGGNSWGNNTGQGFGPNLATQESVQNGFDQAAIINSLNGINTNISNGFATSEVSRCNAQANLLQQMNTMAYNQLANASANQAGLADIKYNIATENAENRNTVTMALQQLQMTNTANTQAILDKLCAHEIEQKNDTIEQLRSQLNIASLAASQNTQTGQLMADNAAQTAAIVNQLRTPAPIPAYVVSNPYGCSC